MPRAVAVVWWLTVAALAGLVLVAVGAVHAPKSVENRLEWAIFVGAALVCVARAVLVAESRLIWGLFGAGLSLYAVGWITYFELQPESSPSVSDAFWLSLYPLAFAAVVLGIRARLRRARTWLWLDGSIAGLALVSIGLRVCLGPVLEGSTETTLTVVAGASYLSADLLMLGMLSALFTLQRGLSRSDFLLAGAFTLLASMDAVYAYQVAHGMSWAGSVDDAVWGLAATFLARAAWADQSHSPRATETTVRTLVPAAAALGAVTYELSSASHSIAALFTLSTVVLVTARLWLSGRESTELLKQVSASRDQLQATIDNMSGVVFFAKDRLGRYVLVNREFEEMMGRDIVGLTDEDLFPPEAVAELRANDAEVMRGGGVIETEERIPHPDGERTFISVKFPYVGPGADGGVCGIGTEITQRIRDEQERRDLEAQLHQSQKLETVGRLAGGIAHDFNNLLAVILNYAEFASSELGSHPARDDVEEIRRAAERAAGLTRQLLVFSRGDRTQPASIDVNAVVRDMSSMLGRTLGEQVELHTQLTPDTPPAHADPTHLEQVLMNLAVNARDAMEGGGRLAISTGAEVMDGVPYVRVTVSDTGTGMSEETLARAFDPFFTTKDPGRGTGLGLATVYGLVTRAGGQVQCTSAPGHGTAVSVLLPLARHAPAEKARPGSPEEIHAPEGTVLLVEDEEALRRMARRLLENEGYAVISAPNGRAALEALEAFDTRVDVLLTDVVMPGMSGIDLAQELQTRLPGLPVVFMSGYSERSDQLPAGSRFVTKPFKGADLLEAVAAGAQSLPVA